MLKNCSENLLKNCSVTNHRKAEASIFIQVKYVYVPAPFSFILKLENVRADFDPFSIWEKMNCIMFIVKDKCVFKCVMKTNQLFILLNYSFIMV